MDELLDWHYFEAQATGMVRNGVSRRGHEELLTYVTLPSFGNAVGLQLIRIHTGKELDYAVRKTTWDRVADSARFKQYETYQPKVARKRLFDEMRPTIREEQNPVPAEDAMELLRRLAAVKLHAYVECKTMGLDGTSYDLYLGRHFLMSVYSWWEEPPKEWEELVSLVRTFFDTHAPLE